MLSFKSLNIPNDVVTCIQMSKAPSELQQLNLNQKGKLIWIVPTKLASHVSVNSLFSEKIRGGTIYVS